MIFIYKQKVGFIKYYRKVQDSWIWDSDEPYCMRSAWDYLLMNAFFKDNKITWKKQIFDLKRGQMITSLRELSQEWKWSTGKVTRFLNKLENENMIVKEDVKNGTLLTIVNYEIYQDKENSNETPTKHQQNSFETETERQRDADGTATEQRQNASETLTEQQRNTIKEDKENNNINNIQEDEEAKENKEDKKKEKIIRGDSDTYKEKTKKFVPPTVQEVWEYCEERHNNVDPEVFVDFYTSKGWMVGKNPMKEWKAAVRTWEKTRNNNLKNQSSKNDYISNRISEVDNW